jgi:hypothetical protein
VCTLGHNLPLLDASDTSIEPTTWALWDSMSNIRHVVLRNPGGKSDFSTA